MVRYVIVPGIGGSDDAHWQSLWEAQWGTAAVRIAPRSWSRPDLADWVDAIDGAVSGDQTDIGDVVLVAHSLGCWAVATWLRAAAVAPRGVMLVAPPDPAGEVFPGWAAPTFLSVTAAALPCPSIVAASTSDPYCTLEVAEGFASAWGSELVAMGDVGHLNSASGLGDWPEGRVILDRLSA